MSFITPRNAILTGAMLWATHAFAAGSGHADPIAPILLAMIAILLTAKLAGELFERLGQPAVLGELLGGVVLGNLILLNPAWNFFEPLRAAVLQEDWAVVIDSFARLGVIILLFEVGLESSVKGMMQVGASSFLVAVIGVIAPFILGYAVSWIFIKDLPAQLAAIVPADFSLSYVHMFMGAVLCATSVGITARVFKDLGKLQIKEAQIILGAAVIDDVLGLIILAIVAGIITAAQAGQALAFGEIARLIILAVVFFGATLAFGHFILPKLMQQLAKLRSSGVMLIAALLIAFGLSYLANAIGLAAIIGAFAAGLILEESHFHKFRDKYELEDLLKPLAAVFVPIFFVLMGIQVRLETFANLSVLGVAAGLTLAAIIGKQVCGFGTLQKGLDRLTIGVGMIPRGEVGLIFAGIGKSLNVIDDATFSAVVIMVIVTTLVTPPILKLTLAQREKAFAG